MGMVNGIRALNALVSGTMSSAQLTTYLATGSNAGSFGQLLQLRGQSKALAASSTAMTAVAASSTAFAAVAASSTAFAAVMANPTAWATVVASSTAMTAVIASSTAMTAVAASSTASVAISINATANNLALGSSYSVGAYLDRVAVAGGATTNATLAAQATMTAVWASDTAADAVLSSSPARLAVYNADTALAALQATPTQIQRKVTSGATLSTNTWAGSITMVANGTKIVILRRYYSLAEFDYINWARGSTTAGVGQGPVAGSGGRTLYTGAAALGCVSGTYTSTGAAPNSNNDTGNFVCAANGLRRDNASAGGDMFVYYIPV